MSELDLTISVVSYNTIDYLRRCLDSIFSGKHEFTFELTVVDNDSRDGSASMVQDEFHEARLLMNDGNVFFTGGHNQALATARGRNFLILNPDTEAPPPTLAAIVAWLDENPERGAVGCQERDGEGNIVPTGARFRTIGLELAKATKIGRRMLTELRNRANLAEWDRRSSRDIDVLTDCFLALPTSLFRDLGGYDEAMRLYFTEDDVARRLAASRKRVHFLADHHYVHHRHRSTETIGDEAGRIFNADRHVYYRTHHGLAYAAAVRASIAVGRRLPL